MQLIVNKLLLGIVVLLLIVSVSFGGMYWYRGVVIGEQKTLLEERKKALNLLKKDRAAQDKADNERKQEGERIQKGKEAFKGKLNEAIKGNDAANTPIPDDSKRMLNDLYNSQRP